MPASNFADLTRRLDLALTVDLIATPPPLTNARRTTSGAVQKQMEETGYDIIPVDDAITGFWVRPSLLSREGQRPEQHTLSAADLVAAGTPISQLLRLMVAQRRGFYFLLQGARVTGLITYADLNKRPARAALYTVITELEETLMQAFDRAHPDEAEWKTWLDRQSYRRIQDRWEIARKTGVELSKVRYASLGQLVILLRRSHKLSTHLSQILGSDWADRLDSLREPVRNALAHPGKLLINTLDDVAKVCSAFDFAEIALSRLVGSHETKPGGRHS